jgi:hypothetical protein
VTSPTRARGRGFGTLSGRRLAPPAVQGKAAANVKGTAEFAQGRVSGSGSAALGAVRQSAAATAWPKLFYIIGPSSGWTNPSASQVKSGLLGGGGPSTASGAQGAPTTSQTVDFASTAQGLTSGVTYRVALVWSDGTNDSNVAVSGDFTTPAGGVSGSSTLTLGAVLQTAASGAVQINSASAATLGRIVATAAGSVAVAGTAASTLGQVTGAAVAFASISASASSTLGAVQQTALGSVISGVSGSQAATLGGLQGAAFGSVSVAGSATAATLAAVTQVSAAAVLLSGSATTAPGAVQATANGVVGFAPALGTQAATLGEVRSAASGTTAVAGSGSATLGTAASTAAAGVRVGGSGAATLGTVTGQAAAVVGVTGSTAQLLGRILGAGAGTVSNQAPIFGSGAAQLNVVRSAGFAAAGPTRGPEDLALFFDPAFTVPAAWGTFTAPVLLDAPTEDIMGGRVLSEEYEATMPASSFPGITRDAMLSIDGGTYRVREVRLMDDGAIKQLLLTRTAGSKPSDFAFSADLDDFFNPADFAETGFWRGTPARLLLDQPTDAIMGGNVLTDSYLATMRTADWPGVARGEQVVIGAATYVVREVRLLDDGATKTLTLRKP